MNNTTILTILVALIIGGGIGYAVAANQVPGRNAPNGRRYADGKYGDGLKYAAFYGTNDGRSRREDGGRF
ncbi:hypothetical protein K2X83_00565 [Patescibacteria group bacterium]|nr:hypothetical protein [Patescibacteria group bacterium]